MHSPSQRCISSGQMTDNIIEIETTALAHVGCDPQESGVLLADFVDAYPSVNLSWIFSVLENSALLAFPVGFCGISGTASLTWNSREQTEDNSLWPEEHDKVVLRVAVLVGMAFDPISRWSKTQLSQRDPTT